MAQIEKDYSNIELIKDIPVEGRLQITNTFEDNELITFIEDVTMQLYHYIKDDYIPVIISGVDDNRKIDYARHKMNVLLDICRNSSSVKKLSKIYNPEENNPRLYSRYMTTLYNIYFDYIKILKAHPDYEIHKDKILNLYSGMKTIPKIESSKILIKHPIDTTLLPNSSFVNSDNQYYLNFKVNLNGLIIPIIGSCFAKWNDLGIDSYTHSEYEFLYIGTCDLDCKNFGHIKTGYKNSYQIYSRMHYFKNDYNMMYIFKKYIDEQGDLEKALIHIPNVNNYWSEIDIIESKLNDILYIKNYSDSLDRSLIKLTYTLFINNILNKFINDKTSYNEFIYDMRYILYILKNQINKIGFIESDIIQSIDFIILFTNDNPNITIRDLCKNKILNQDILINNKYSPEYIEIYTTDCTVTNSFKKSILNERIEFNKYLKYKIKYLKSKHSQNLSSMSLKKD